MEQPSNQSVPFKRLGDKLKSMREVAKESLADVSGAVEIEVTQLTAIETGNERPSEDILLLLISHFNLKEDEAINLWELAGYEQQSAHFSISNDMDSQDQPAVMVMPIDARIVYSDMVHVMVNNYGVIMNFMQGAGPQNKPLAIARIGMSKEHAKSVLEVLQKTLAQSEKEDAARAKKVSSVPSVSNNKLSKPQTNPSKSSKPATKKSDASKSSSKPRQQSEPNNQDSPESGQATK